MELDLGKFLRGDGTLRGGQICKAGKGDMEK